MKLSDLKKLADAFERSDWDEVHLVADGVEIHLSTQAGPAGTAPIALAGPAVGAASSAADASPSAAAVPVPPTAPPPPPPPPPPPAGPVSGPAGATASPAAPAAPAAEAGGTAVLSPTPGIFWRSPAPGAPPFVDVGQRVEADTPICIVEVMKLMNRVPAGVAGTVTAVLVGNGEQVDRAQPLVLVDESR